MILCKTCQWSYIGCTLGMIYRNAGFFTGMTKCRGYCENTKSSTLGNRNSPMACAN